MRRRIAFLFLVALMLVAVVAGPADAKAHHKKSGYNAGYRAGYNAGYSAGYSAGYNEGFNVGYIYCHNTRC